jgi:transposase
LTPEQQLELQRLYAAVPDLEFVYWFRWGVTEIFDTAADAEEAARRLEDYRQVLDELDEDHEGQAMRAFFTTYDAHREGILAYFVERKTSGVVEGINNKARVIIKRCYGLKSLSTFWERLRLDLNLASRITRCTLAGIKQIVDAIRQHFLGSYT